jgi:hypothetical protein
MTTFTISASIAARSFVSISGPSLLKSAYLEDVSSIKPIFTIDNVPITEHNRKFDSDFAFSPIINSRWNNATGVYFRTQNAKQSFSFQWSFVPGNSYNTVDLNAGRDYIKSIAANPFEHTLTIRNLDSNGLSLFTVNTYSVLVVEYNETLIRRDLDIDEYYWDCSLKLEEV